jgi:hypothetical protein
MILDSHRTPTKLARVSSDTGLHMEKEKIEELVFL